MDQRKKNPSPVLIISYTLNEMIFGLHLQRAGIEHVPFSIHSYESAEGAIVALMKRYVQHPVKEHGFFSLIVITIDQKKEGITGLSLLKAIKEKELLANINVIIVNKFDVFAMMRARLAGAASYAFLPLEGKKFIALVKKYMQ